MAKKDIEQIYNIWERQKKNRIMAQESREVEVVTLLLGNDKDNVIADTVLTFSVSTPSLKYV